MKHPRSRSERRFAREVWRDRRRKIVVTLYTPKGEDPTDNMWWLHSGKQCSAHGNRCMHSMLERYLRHQEVKRLRRNKFTGQ